MPPESTILTIELSSGLRLSTTRANSTAALLFRRALGIPIDNSAIDSKNFAVNLIQQIGDEAFDRGLARAIVQVFPDIDKDLVWFDNPAKSPQSSIVGLPIEDVMKIALEVVLHGTEKKPAKARQSPIQEAAQLNQDIQYLWEQDSFEVADEEPEQLTPEEIAEYRRLKASQGKGYATEG
jgi:hypothetical protein